MNVVGKVGSLISQGVYSVATPFHPFGGAVDIIVVEQEDGTYRSTPWYVRFGKFQGIMKTSEKVVSINVNGVEADFHMYLDHSGQAYFLREVENNDPQFSSSNETSPHKSIKEDTKGNDSEVHEATNEVKDEHSYDHSPSFSNYNYGNLDEVEELVNSNNESNSEMVLVSVDGHVLTAPISANVEDGANCVQSNPQFHLGPGEDTKQEYGALFDDLETSEFNVGTTGSPKDKIMDYKLNEEANIHGEISHEDNQFDTGSNSEDACLYRNKDDLFKSCLDLSSHIQDGYIHELDADTNTAVNTSNVSSFTEIITEEAPIDTNVESKLEDGMITSDVNIQNYNKAISDNSLVTNNLMDLSEETSITEPSTCADGTESVSNSVAPVGLNEVEGECSNLGPERKSCGFGFEISLCGSLFRPGMGRISAKEVFDAHLLSEEKFKAHGPSIIKNSNLIVRYKGNYFPFEKAVYAVLGKASFGSDFTCDQQDCIPLENLGTPKLKDDETVMSPSRRWRLWPIPFRRAASLEHSNSNSSSEECFVDSESALQSPSVEHSLNASNSQSPRKQFLRTFIPTNEQIASLKLKDGQNIIAFSFSTRVLGKQEVDAHIYLWKWNARIVISDVDGTITKSDVLGQVMPLVGKDWSQSGVAGLFSAIEENGYQLLFLSARAIVQAYLTRSFLKNLKQDGKGLPSGPIVISPDGLFPSLYREVIRRAPHEFKIACLEDIKALFPSDYNPFYAGFGNRDTDELSYRKIGIPKGKIFIINPKGEVAINHCIDVKSYTSLHTLVNDMFPPTSLVEQEDYNSWNYWKIPLADIE